jgi:hypothetical protein
MFRLSPRLAALVAAAALLTAVVPALAADGKAADEPTAAAITRVEPSTSSMSKTR